MINYIFKLFIVFTFSMLIAFFYYTINNYTHIENFDWYIYYLAPIFIIYIIYKYFKNIQKTKNIEFSLIEITLYFLLNLLLLSMVFFYFAWWEQFTTFFWINLFFKIILYLIFPIILIFIIISLWRKLLRFFNLLVKEEWYNIFNFLVSLSLGFFSFVFLLTILWLLWFYNLTTVMIILLLFIIISRKEIWELFKWLLSYKISFENHDFQSKNLLNKLALKLISTEFLFILATIVLSVNLINIVRPMPIGWDDLWVYMNFPRQMAYSWVIDTFWSMYSWQVFTWIWYMISEPVQAFFLNNIWWFLSFIVMLLIVSDLLSNLKNNKKTLINIPLLLSICFISMPMVVFQQAKDMKLDEGLFFISITSLYIIIKILWNFKEASYKFSSSQILKLLFIAWILSWFAFSIKFTALLLISAIIWLIFYLKIWLSWFLWYIWIYFAIFTKANLWSYMNIVYPKENLELINIFSLLSFLFWAILIWLWVFKYKKELLNLMKYISVFILGIILALTPWIWKNINQALDKDVSINLWILLSWKSESFNIDLEKIHTKKQLENIEKTNQKLQISASWTTSNEDFWRYFGYEKGINNYIKLPWNLTMQVNQWWEFTTIWWLFLALIPWLLLFLKYRKKYLEYFIILFLMLEILVFIIPQTKEFFTTLMANFTLPWWYIIILWLFLLSLFYFIFLLKNNSLNNLFKYLLIFSTFYIFLFTISSFWIVWYWIVMYFCLLLIIWLWIYSISNYKDDDKNINLKQIWTLLIFSIFLLYFFLSIFPYSFNNLKNSWYTYFKTWTLTWQEAIFAYKPEYKTILLKLNIDNNKQKQAMKSAFNLKSTNEKFIYWLIIENKLDYRSSLDFLDQIYNWGLDNQLLSALKQNKNILYWIKKTSKKIKLKLLDIILDPSEEFKNKDNIYRIWTFLKYYIVNNNKRLIEDSLVEFFPKYLYDKNSSTKTLENIKKLWLNYILIDLNAATIDNDPSRNLTNRYENLLKIFTNEKIWLVESDSICLKLSLDKYKKSKKTDKDILDYLNLAWVNHESYFENNTKVIRRDKKLKFCHFEIATLFEKDEISSVNYPYLFSIYKEYKVLLKNKQIKTENDIYKYLTSKIPYWSKALFEIK